MAGRAAQEWRELVRAMGSEHAAAAAMDYEVARRAAAARLAKKGIRRDPTEREIGRILEAM